MRVALGVAYNGQRYSGWQSQLSGNTIQDHLEAALGRFAAQEVHTLCAGRTDAGVHGLMQVVHFDTPLDRAPFSWVRGTNTFLPPDIAVQWAQPVPDSFHSRACATARRYAYVLLQSPVRPSVEAGRVGWVFHALNGDAMQAAAQHLVQKRQAVVELVVAQRAGVKAQRAHGLVHGQLLRAGDGVDGGFVVGQRRALDGVAVVHQQRIGKLLARGAHQRGRALKAIALVLGQLLLQLDPAGWTPRRLTVTPPAVPSHSPTP